MPISAHINDADTNELWQLGASQIAALVKSRRVSAVEVAQASLDRLEAVNPEINAVVEYRPEETLAQAEALDAAIARGEPTGPLAGVPVTIKVNTGADQDQVVMTGGRLGTVVATDTLNSVEYITLGGNTAEGMAEADVLDVTTMTAGAVVDYTNGQAQANGKPLDGSGMMGLMAAMP